MVTLYRLLFICLVTTLSVVSAFAQGAHWNNGTGGSGSGGAPTDAQYVVVDYDGTLSGERKIQSLSSFITLTDNGANMTLDIGIGTLAVADGGTGATTAAGAAINLLGTPTKGYVLTGDGSDWTAITIGADGTVPVADSAEAVGWRWGSPGGLDGEPYITQALSSNLSAERVLAAGSGIQLTDGGANGNMTVAIDSTVATLTGSQSLSNKTLTDPVVDDTITVELGANDVILAFTAPAAGRTYTFPDGGGDVQVVLAGGAQTIAGVKTFSSAPVLSTGTVTVSGQTITFPAATDTITLLAATQTLTNKTLTSPIMGTSVVLDQTTADYTVTWDNPAAARAVNVEDWGGDTDLLAKSQSDAHVNKGVLYSDGTKVKFTAAGTDGYVLTQTSSGPAFQAAAGASVFKPTAISSSLRALPTSGSISGTYVSSSGVTSAGNYTAASGTRIYMKGNFVLGSGHTFTVSNLGNGGDHNVDGGPTLAGGISPGAGSGIAVGDPGGGGGSYASGGRATTTTYGPAGGKGTGLTAVMLGGSGGGASYYGDGGHGGGAVLFEVDGDVTINENMTAVGSASSAVSDYSGGGGGGGTVIIRATGTITIASGKSISCAGGAAASATNRGGGGGGGYIELWAPTVTVTGSTSTAGGAGANSGSNGTTTTISASPISW